jgi:hypothetical protein
MFIDPDDNLPLAMVCEYYKNEVNFVFHDTPLNVMFNEFKSGEKGHMAFVQVDSFEILDIRQSLKMSFSIRSRTYIN